MKLRPYQEAGRDFLASRRVALLADEMRVGKTPQAILAAEAIGAWDILVVCPAIAVPQWEREFATWWTGELPNFAVVSYDRARISADQLTAVSWDVLIVDEGHFAKNPFSKRTKAIYGKGGLAWQADYTWVLTGTPAPKHAGELWPMLRTFGVTPLNYDAFTSRYCMFNWATGRITGTKVAMLPELRAMLAGVMLRRTRAQVAPEVPAISAHPLYIDLPVDLHAPAGLSDDDLFDWMRRHPCIDTENRIAVADAKALPLVEQIEFAIQNELLTQTVVFGWHVKPLEKVVAALRQVGIAADLLNGTTSPKRRVEIQDDFRHGRLQVVVANILAAGTAINLSAASHGYILELDWVPGNNQQAMNRLISVTKREPVTFDVLTMPDSIDAAINRVLVRRMKEIGGLYS